MMGDGMLCECGASSGTFASPTAWSKILTAIFRKCGQSHGLSHAVILVGCRPGQGGVIGGQHVPISGSGDASSHCLAVWELVPWASPGTCHFVIRWRARWCARWRPGKWKMWILAAGRAKVSSMVAREDPEEALG